MKNITCEKINKKLTASGRVLKELSKTIPNSKFALIELIKNAFEAGAETVTITLNNDSLVIEDDGIGISESMIESLLNIGASHKKFGEDIFLNNKRRITSGSKGLGFYSVFKFGKTVTVDTVCDEIQLNFKLNYDEIVAVKDISDFSVELEKTENTDRSRTRIIIDDLNTDEYSFLLDDFKNQSVCEKIKNAIQDSDFSIKIIDNIPIITDKKEKIDLSNYKFATIKYNSSVNKNAILIEQSGERRNLTIPKEYTELFDENPIEIDISIDHYNFTITSPKIGVSDMPPLYYKGDNNKAITPLIYINNAFYDNYSLYNIEINASGSNSTVSRQQTGFIKIMIRDDIIEFNSDRTSINENKISRKLKGFLDYFSSTTQKNVKEYKKSEPTCRRVEIYESEGDNSIPSSLEGFKLFYNSNEVKGFDNKKVGIWEFKKDNGDTILVKVKPYLIPSIKQVRSVCTIFNEYEIGELFECYNSYGSLKDVTVEYDFVPVEYVKLDVGTITFMQPMEYKVNLKVCDKKSGKMKEQKFSIMAKGIGKTEFVGGDKVDNDDFIYSYFIDKPFVLNSDLNDLIKEYNYLYNDENFRIAFVALSRVMIELVIEDIIRFLPTNISAKCKNDSMGLYDKYKHVIECIVTTFKNEISKDNSKKISDITKIISDDDLGLTKSFVRFLNLGAHKGTRLVLKEEIVNRRVIFNYLFNFLLFKSYAEHGEKL